jgi:menaquinone-dependent protoporphyrinogen oxidase
MTVLIGYATAHGSTREVAERIAQRLTERGCRVECRAADQVQGTDGYEAVVLGSAVHGGQWLPAAADLLEREAETLAGRPVWLFSVSSVGEHSSAFSPAVTRRMRSMRTAPAAVAGARESVRPRGHHDFAGVVERSHWGRLGRAFMTVTRARYGDHRNGAEIDAWAGDIAHHLTHDRG